MSKKIFKKPFSVVLLILFISQTGLGSTFSHQTINVVADTIIDIYPKILDVNVWYDVEGVTHQAKAEKIRITAINVEIYTETDKKVFSIDKVTKLHVLIKDKSESSSLSQLREKSTVTKKLKFKQPDVSNAWVTINGTKRGQMVEEIFYIADFVLIQKQQNILYIYPCESLDGWYYEVVDGTPPDILRDLIYDLNTKDPEKITKWMSKGIKINMLLSKNLEFQGFLPPINEGNFMTTILTVYDLEKQLFFNYAVVLKKIEGQWTIIGWHSPN